MGAHSTYHVVASLSTVHGTRFRQAVFEAVLCSWKVRAFFAGSRGAVVKVAKQ